jgi:hypothetical protein
MNDEPVFTGKFAIRTEMFQYTMGKKNKIAKVRRAVACRALGYRRPSPELAWRLTIDKVSACRTWGSVFRALRMSE